MLNCSQNFYVVNSGSSIDLHLMQIYGSIQFFIDIPCDGLPVSEFNELKPRLKSPEHRFQLSAGLNLEKLNTILSETNHIWVAA